MRILAFLVGLFVCNLSQAQLRFGLELGMNAGAPIPKKISKGAEGKLGINPILGLAAQYKLSKRLTLQAALYYDRKSARYTSPVQYPYIVISGDSIDSFSGNVSGTFRNQYLTLPIHVRYAFNTKWSAGGGCYISYLLQGTNKGVVTNGKAGFNGAFAIDDQLFDESGNIHHLDAGLNALVQYQLRKHLSLQWQLAYGIPSVTQATDNFKDKTHNIYTYLTLGYWF
jgi:hypothetical protein